MKTINNSGVTYIEVKNAVQIKETAKIAEEIWQEYYPPLITQKQTDYMVNNFQSEKAITENIEAGSEYYIVILNNEKLGYFALREETERMFLSKIYLYKENRGKGYAEYIMSSIENLTRERGKKAVYLHVFKGNEKSIEIYKRWGFKVTGKIETDIGEGFIMDDFEMEKTLE